MTNSWDALPDAPVAATQPQKNPWDELPDAPVQQADVPFTSRTRAALLGDTDLSGTIGPLEGIVSVGRQLKYGATSDLPRMVGDAMKYVSEEGEWFYEQGQSITDWVDQQEKDNPDLLYKYEWDKNPVMHVFGGGARMIPQSLGPPVGLAALVAGTIALLPASAAAAVATGTGAAIVAGATAIAGGLPMGLAQGQQTYQKLIDAGVDEETARNSSRWSGLVEWGGESVGNMFAVAKWPMKMLGIGVKGPGKIVAKDAIEYLTKLAGDPKIWGTAAGKTIADIAKTMGIEVGTEIGQAVGQTAIENVALAKVGVEPTPLIEAAKEVIGPTIGMTLLMAPLGINANVRDVRRQNAIKDALTDPRIHPQSRAAAAMAVAKDLYDVLPDTPEGRAPADNFAINATTAITLGRVIPLSEDSVKDPAEFHNDLFEQMQIQRKKQSISDRMVAISREVIGEKAAKKAPEAIPAEEVVPEARFVSQKSAQTEMNDQVEVKPLTESVWNEFVKPAIAKAAYTFQTYKAKFPGHTHVALTQLTRQPQQLAGVGTRTFVEAPYRAQKGIFQEVEAFGSGPAIVQSGRTTEAYIGTSPHIRFEGDPAEVMGKVTGKTARETPVAWQEIDRKTRVISNYLTPVKEVKSIAGPNVRYAILPKSTYEGQLDKVFFWDGYQWENVGTRLISKENRPFHKQELLKMANDYIVKHPSAKMLTKEDVEREPFIERGLTSGTAGLPLLYGTEEKDMPTNIKQADIKMPWYSRVLKKVTSMPLFQGNKQDMSYPVGKAILDEWTSDERNKITVIEEYFGGGGGWGLHHVLTRAFLNVKRIIIHEVNAERIEMIKFIHKRGDKFREYLKKNDTMRIVKGVWNSTERSKEIKSGGGLAGRLNTVLKENVWDTKPLTAEQRIGIQIIADLVGRANMIKKSLDKTITAIEEEQTTPAYEAAQEFKNIYGGDIEYVERSSYDPKLPITAGENVLAVVDPPYVFTTGYDGKGIVGTDIYQQTAALNDRLINADNNVIYTDSAWWVPSPKEPRGLTEVEKQEWKLERTQRQAIPITEKETALSLLGEMIGKFDRFARVKKLIGGHRYEVLGLRNAFRKYRKGTEAEAEYKAPTPTESEAKRQEIEAALPYKPGDKVMFRLKSTSVADQTGRVVGIIVHPDGNVTTSIKLGGKSKATKEVATSRGGMVWLMPQEEGRIKGMETRARNKEELSQFSDQEQKEIRADASTFDKVAQYKAQWESGKAGQAAPDDGFTDMDVRTWAFQDIAAGQEIPAENEMKSPVTRANALPILLESLKELPYWSALVSQGLTKIKRSKQMSVEEQAAWQKGLVQDLATKPEVSLAKRRQESEGQLEMSWAPTRPPTTRPYTPPAPVEEKKAAPLPPPTPTKPKTPSRVGAIAPLKTPEVGAGALLGEPTTVEDKVASVRESIMVMAASFNIPNMNVEEVKTFAMDRLNDAAMKHGTGSGAFSEFARTSIKNKLRSLQRDQIKVAKRTGESLSRPIDRGNKDSPDRITIVAEPGAIPPDQILTQRKISNDMADIVGTLNKTDKETLNDILDEVPNQDIMVRRGQEAYKVTRDQDTLRKKLRGELEKKGYSLTDIADAFMPPSREMDDPVSMSKANQRGAPIIAGPVTQAQAQSRVDNYINKERLPIRVVVLNTIADAIDYGMSGETYSMLVAEQPRGFYHRQSGRFFVVADALQTPDEAIEVTMHEVLGHHGVEAVLGKDYFNDVLKLSDEIPYADLQKTANLYSAQLPEQGLPNPLDSEKNRVYAALEHIAARAEAEPTMYQKLIEILRKALTQILPGTYVNKLLRQGGIDRLLQSAREYLKTGQATTPEIVPGAAPPGEVGLAARPRQEIGYINSQGGIYTETVSDAMKADHGSTFGSYSIVPGSGRFRYIDGELTWIEPPTKEQSQAVEEHYNVPLDEVSMAKTIPPGRYVQTNPITTDEGGRLAYLQLISEFFPDHVSEKQVEAAVLPEIDKRGIRNVIARAAERGFDSFFKTGKEGTVFGKAVMNRPEFLRMFKDPKDLMIAVNIVNSYAEKGSETALDLQFRQVRKDELYEDLTTGTPEEIEAKKKLMAEKRQSMLTQMITTSEEYARWSKLTPTERKVAEKELQARITNAAEAMRRMGYDDWTNIGFDVLNDDAQFMQILSEVSATRSSGLDKVYEYWRNSILSGMQTNIVNAFSNLIFGSWSLFVQRPAEALLNQFVQVPGAPTFESLARAYALIGPNIINGYNAMVRSWRYEVGDFAKIETEGRTALKGKFGRFVRMPQRGLLAMDEFFKTIYVAALTADYATRFADSQGLIGQGKEDFIANALKDEDGPMHEQAHTEARRLLFQSAPGDIGSRLISARHAPGVTGLAFKFTIPFVTTPANLIKIGFYMSPFGMLRMGYEGVKKLAGAKEGRYIGDETGGHLVTDIVEQAFAWSLLGLLYALSTPPDPDDPDDKQFLQITGSLTGTPAERRFRQFSRPPQSIKIGDKWFSYARIEPFATSLTMMIDALDTFRNVKGGKPLSSQDALKVLSLVRDKTYLQGLGDIMRGLEDPNQWVKMGSNFGSSWVPNIFRQAVRGIDPVLRDPRVRSKGLEALWEAGVVRSAQAALPIAPLQQMPRYDHWGNPIRKDIWEKQGGQALSDVVWRMVMPVRAQTERNVTNIDRMIWNYNRAQTKLEDQYFPGTPRPTVKIRGETIKMTDKQYEHFLRQRGKLALEFSRRMRWNFGNPTPIDIKRLEKVFTRASRIARTVAIGDIIREEAKQQAKAK